MYIGVCGAMDMSLYIFLFRITRPVYLAMSVFSSDLLSVCLSVRMNAEISETTKARCHAHSNALEPPKPVALTMRRRRISLFPTLF